MLLRFLILFTLSLDLLAFSEVRAANVCIQRNGFEFCAENRGLYRPADILGNTFDSKRKSLRFQIVKVRISNHTTRPVLISPEDFQGQSDNGMRYVVDESLRESIQWPDKLSRGIVLPRETKEGDLIFPVFSEVMHRLIYNGTPYFETSLY